MLNRRIFMAFAISAVPASPSISNPIAAATLSQRLIKIIKAIKKPTATIATSAFAGVVSAKVMKEFEHAHDDAPALHVIAYYGLIGNKKFDDASNFWIYPPEKHLEFMKTFQSIELQDIKELSKTPDKATVWITLKGKQIGKQFRIWQGTVQLIWTDHNWLISSTEIMPRT